MYLLDDRVSAVDFVGGNGVKFCQIGWWEECAEPAYVEQLALSLVLLRSRIGDRVDVQPAKDMAAFLFGK